MKHIIAVQKSETTSSIKNFFIDKGVEIVIFNDLDEINTQDYELVVLHNFEKNLDKAFESPTKFINFYSSLSPKIPSEVDFLQNDFLTLKVSGVTVFDINNNKIIAQYPVLIGLGMHYDEFIRQLIDIENKLLPAVIDSILEDRVFDFKDLFSHRCNHSSGCSNCKNCH